jgi:hypothetical protein
MSARATSPARFFVAAALFLSGASLLAPQPRAQSLADVAKKEEDRRKSVAAPAKVYTNKELNPVPAASPPPAATKPADGAAKDKDADTDAKGKGSKAPDAGDKAGDKAAVKDQAYWAGKYKGLQDALLRDQNYADAMQTRINSLSADFVNRDDPAQRSVIERDRQKALAELARLKQSILDTKKSIADFEEEARRAGVPPGWLR